MNEVKKGRNINKIFSKYFDESCYSQNISQNIKDALSEAYDKGANDLEYDILNNSDNDIMEHIIQVCYSISVLTMDQRIRIFGDLHLGEEIMVLFIRFSVAEIEKKINDYRTEKDIEAEKIAKDIWSMLDTKLDNNADKKEVIYKLLKEYEKEVK